MWQTAHKRVYLSLYAYFLYLLLSLAMCTRARAVIVTIENHLRALSSIRLHLYDHHVRHDGVEGDVLWIFPSSSSSSTSTSQSSSRHTTHKHWLHHHLSSHTRCSSRFVVYRAIHAHWGKISGNVTSTADLMESHWELKVESSQWVTYASWSPSLGATIV